MNPDEPLRTKNLAEEDPAPMDDTLGGYPWLPRMIDKARAGLNDSLGSYYKYPCPIDAQCLLLLGLSSSAFQEIAATAQTGGDVLHALAEAEAQLDAAKRFDPVALNERLHSESS